MKSPSRYEFLFELDSPTADALVASASRQIPTPSIHETVSDCYYESADLKAQAKAARRRHVRTRRIDNARDLYLESLNWERDTCSLRQTRVPSNELTSLRSDVVDGTWAGKWFHKKLLKHNLQPSVEVCFDSVTLKQQTPEGEIRLIVERNLRADLVSTPQSNTSRPAAVEANIVRMNFDVSLPSLFKTLIYEFTLLPEPPSVLLSLAKSALRQCDMRANATWAPMQPGELSAGELSMGPRPITIKKLLPDPVRGMGTRPSLPSIEKGTTCRLG